MNKKIAAVLIGIVAVFWGLSFVAISQLLNYLEPIQILALRWTLSSIVFIIFIALGKIRFNLKNKNVIFLLLTGLCEPCIYSVFETYGIKYTSASVSAIFIATIPSVTLLASVILFKKNPGILGISGIVIALAGVVVTTAFAKEFSAEGHVIGYFIMSGAVIAGTIYGFACKKAGETYDASSITAVMAFLGMIVFNSMCLIRGNYSDMFISCFDHPKIILGIAFLGICCSSICYMAFNHLIKTFEISTTSNIISAAITAVGVLGGIYINHDPAGINTIIGMIMTIIGVWLSYKSIESQAE